MYEDTLDCNSRYRGNQNTAECVCDWRWERGEREGRIVGRRMVYADAEGLQSGSVISWAEVEHWPYLSEFLEIPSIVFADVVVRKGTVGRICDSLFLDAHNLPISLRRAKAGSNLLSFCPARSGTGCPLVSLLAPCCR